jgi:hypothetical protein
MAKTEVTQYTAVSGNQISSSSWNAYQDAVQAEFENRTRIGTVAGVISGLLCSISTTSIAVAAGEGYGDGLKYAGAESLAFSGTDAAGTYYVYWDSSAEALAKSTTVPDTSIDILLCSTYWNGADTHSALVDLRARGIVPLPLRSCAWSIGTVTTGKKDQFTCPPGTSLWIDGIAIVQADNGSDSSTIVDVHVGSSGSAPVTIFTTQANRPSVANAVTNWTVTYSGIPDTRLVTAGQNVYVEVDQVGDSAQDLSVTIYGRWLRA